MTIRAVNNIFYMLYIINIVDHFYFVTSIHFGPAFASSYIMLLSSSEGVQVKTHTNIKTPLKKGQTDINSLNTELKP